MSALVWSSLTWPRAIEGDQLKAGLRQLAGSRLSPVFLRAEATAGRVRHLVAAPSERAVEALVRPVPGVAISPAELGTSDLTSAVSVRFSTRRRMVDVEDQERMVQTLLQALATVRGNERLVLEWVLSAPLAPQAVPNRVEGMGPERWSDALLAAPWRGSAPLDGERRNALRDKRAEPGWRVLGRLGVRAATTTRSQYLLSGVISALRAIESPGLRLVIKRCRPSSFGRVGTFGHAPAALNISEVALLAALPIGETAHLPIERVTSKRLSAHPAMPVASDNGNQRSVATSNHPGTPKALVLPPTEALRHLHVLGPTGVGKSTLLLNLITTDMKAGRSVVVVDPKGDLARDVLARVPTERTQDVVVLDPTHDPVVGLNPLATPADPDLVADGLLGVLHQLFESSWGPRTNDILHAGLLSLARAGNQSLVMLPWLLTNQTFRRRLTANLDDPLGVEGFWAWYESISEQQRLAAIGPVMNKLRVVLMRPGLRSMVGQSHPRFQMADVLRSPRILIVNLARGTLGPEGASLFGALVMHQLWQAVQARSAVPGNRRRLVMTYLDEFQDYLKLPLDLTEMLVQARGLGLGLTLAHQHLGQLPTNVREAVLGNAGSRVVFRLNPGDASAVARGSSVLEADDITGLGAFEVFADLLVAGAPSGWMSGTTQPAATSTTDPDEMRRISSANWGITRTDTEAELRAVLGATRGPTTSESPEIGPRRRHPGGEA